VNKNTIIYLIIAVLMILVAGATVRLAQESADESAKNSPAVYDGSTDAGKLAEGMVGITKDNYEEVVNSEGLVVVDFYAPSCPYCVKYNPIFAEVFKEYREQAVFGKYDVTKDSSVITSLNIKGTPTTILFMNGKEVGRIDGYVEAEALRAEVEKAIAS